MVCVHCRISSSFVARCCKMLQAFMSTSNTYCCVIYVLCFLDVQLVHLRLTYNRHWVMACCEHIVVSFFHFLWVSSFTYMYYVYWDGQAKLLPTSVRIRCWWFTRNRGPIQCCTLHPGAAILQASGSVGAQVLVAGWFWLLGHFYMHRSHRSFMCTKYVRILFTWKVACVSLCTIPYWRCRQHPTKVPSRVGILWFYKWQCGRVDS